MGVVDGGATGPPPTVGWKLPSAVGIGAGGTVGVGGDGTVGVDVVSGVVCGVGCGVVLGSPGGDGSIYHFHWHHVKKGKDKGRRDIGRGDTKIRKRKKEEEEE